MTIKDAILLFSKNFPDRKVIGYWKKENGYVLNTKPILKTSFIEPGQFMVRNDGNIYGTNPMNMELDQASYIRI